MTKMLFWARLPLPSSYTKKSMNRNRDRTKRLFHKIRTTIASTIKPQVLSHVWRLARCFQDDVVKFTLRIVRALVLCITKFTLIVSSIQIYLTYDLGAINCAISSPFPRRFSLPECAQIDSFGINVKIEGGICYTAKIPACVWWSLIPPFPVEMLIGCCCCALYCAEARIFEALHFERRDRARRRAKQNAIVFFIFNLIYGFLTFCSKRNLALCNGHDLTIFIYLPWFVIFGKSLHSTELFFLGVKMMFRKACCVGNV